MYIKSQKQSGYILITTMLVMIILFVIGIAGAMLVYYGNMTSGAMINYSKAYYNSDYGLQQVAYNAMNGICNCQNNGCSFSQTLPTGGSVNVITQADTNNITCFIESIGTGQNGGQVAKAVAISGGSSWAALGVINGSLDVKGSGSVSGCDSMCNSTGILEGNSLSIYIQKGEYNGCTNLPHNLQGVYGNPATNSTSLSDVSQLITKSSTFSQLQTDILTQAQTQGCYCSGDATASGSSITCGSSPLPTTCQYYYINDDLNVNSSYMPNNIQTIYANELEISTNGNSVIGSQSVPVILIANSADITMVGTSSINGLLIFNTLDDFSIGNSSIYGAMYVNNAENTDSGNASINFNYAILSQITNAFPNIFQPINCYSQGTQESLLNASTLY